MQCSSQLQAYLRRLEGEGEGKGEDEDEGAVEKAVVPNVTLARHSLSSALVVVLECTMQQVKEAWTEDLIWFAVAPPPARRHPHHELIVFLCGIGSLGLIPLLLYLLGCVIKYNLARLRDEVATAQSATGHVLHSIRKVQLTCLGRRLTNPLSPLGNLPEEETRLNNLGLFDARAALQRALSVLQKDVQCGDDVKTPFAADSNISRATPLLAALSGTLLSTHVDAALDRLLTSLDADGGLARLRALVLLPLQLRGLCAVLQRYQRSVVGIRRALCADLPSPHLSNNHSRMTLCTPRTNGASGQYIKARTALLQLRTRLETLQSKLWLCERLLCTPEVLNLLVQGGIGSTQKIAHTQAQSAVREAVELLLGRGSVLGEEEDDSLLLSLAPERHDYSHLCRQLAGLRDAVERVVSGRDASASAEPPAEFTEGTRDSAESCLDVEGGGRLAPEGEEVAASAVYENGVGIGVDPVPNLPELIPDLRAGIVDVYLGRSMGRQEDLAATKASPGADALEAVRRRSLAQGMVRELEERIAPHAAARVERMCLLAGEPLDEDEPVEELQTRESEEETGQDLLLLRAGSRDAAASIFTELMASIPLANRCDILGDDE